MQRKGRCAVFAALLAFGLAAPVPVLAADGQPADKPAATQEAQVAGEGTAAAATAENEKAASSAAEPAAAESKTATATGNAAEDISKGHWTTSGTKRSYVLADGKVLKNELVQIGGSTYLFDNDGYAMMGWQTWNGHSLLDHR